MRLPTCLTGVLAVFHAPFCTCRKATHQGQPRDQMNRHPESRETNPRNTSVAGLTRTHPRYDFRWRRRPSPRSEPHSSVHRSCSVQQCQRSQQRVPVKSAMQLKCTQRRRRTRLNQRPEQYASTAVLFLATARKTSSRGLVAALPRISDRLRKDICPILALAA